MLINLYLAITTEKAYGFTKEQRKEKNEKSENIIWLPKSQASVKTQDEPDEGFLPKCSVEIADWLAEKYEFKASTKGKTPEKKNEQKIQEDDFDDDIPF